MKETSCHGAMGSLVPLGVGHNLIDPWYIQLGLWRTTWDKEAHGHGMSRLAFKLKALKVSSVCGIEKFLGGPRSIFKS